MVKGENLRRVVMLNWFSLDGIKISNIDDNKSGCGVYIRYF